MKSMHRTPAGKLIISVSALREELAAHGWRMGKVAIMHAETPNSVKTALKLTSMGKALVAEYGRHRPKSGPGGKRVTPRAGNPVQIWLTDDELVDVRSAANGPLAPWIARVAVERARGHR